MTCNNQIEVPNRLFGASHKYYDRLNWVDTRFHTALETDRTIKVPCGKCPICLSNRRNDWTFRISEEFRVSKSAFFITLTYDNVYLPVKLSDNDWTRAGDLEVNELAETYASVYKKDVQLFLKRLRQRHAKYIDSLKSYPVVRNIASKWPKIRYFAVGEYGNKSTLRPHYHLIIFNLRPELVNKITETWGMGNTLTGTVKTASIHYVTKYLIHNHKDFYKREKPFSLMSRKPAIGHCYLESTKDYHRALEKMTVNHNGNEIRLPRYYKDRMFNRYILDKYRKEITENKRKEFWEKFHQLEDQGMSTSDALTKLLKDQDFQSSVIANRIIQQSKKSKL